MPIYEYNCKKCGTRFDAFRWPSETEDSALCPKCGSKETERQLSVFSSGAGQGGGSCSPKGFS